MTGILADTSVLLDYLRGATLPSTDALLESEESAMSLITYFEALRYLHKTVRGADFQFASQRLLQFTQVTLSPSICEMAARFAHERGLSTADALIYATARQRGLTLVTSDSDLKGLPGVTFVKNKS